MKDKEGMLLTVLMSFVLMAIILLVGFLLYFLFGENPIIAVTALVVWAIVYRFRSQIFGKDLF